MRRLWGLAALALGACVSAPPPAPPATPAEGSVIGTPGNPPFYEVLGQRYYVLPSAAGYRERGVASWYGGKFHGRNTSNGERYDMYELTAAHKTLPIPTWVRVTNLRNGASIVVRVNDRGPFVKNRVIDLSFAAARAIDMIGAGTTLVEVEALAGQPAAPAPPVVAAADSETRPWVPASAEPIEAVAAVAEPPAGPDGSAVALSEPPTEPLAPTPAPAGLNPLTASPAAPLIYVQVGAYRDPANARRMQARLYNAAIENVGVANDEREGLPLYRVRIGPVDGVAGYDRVIAQLEALGIGETHLITE